MKGLLIPVQKYAPLAGRFCWPGSVVLASPSAADLLPLGQLASDLRARLGARVALARNAAGDAALRVRRAVGRIPGLPSDSPDAYRLTVSPAGIDILAATDSAAYYALQTLREMIALAPRSLPACRIDDWPDFARRGLYHDCSRGKVPTLQTLQALVERLARWKINELQLYVENVFAFAAHPAIGRGYSPLTAGEILALQDHCKLHHVRLVGSLASFGHMEKILALPQYAPLGETPVSADTWSGTLCPTDPRSIRFVEELYREFLPLFEAADFNLCGDETIELGKGRSQKLASRIGVGCLYLDFLLKLHRLCRKFGKRTNAWADIVLEHPDLLHKLPRDIVMLNWDYNAGGSRVARTGEIARAGLPFMVCPGTSSWQTHGTRLANSMQNVAELAAQGRAHHAQGLLNTDWGDFGHRQFLGASLHSFAHGAACAWNGRAVDPRTFTQAFCRHAFGQTTPQLARALRLLGDSYRQCGAPYRNHCALYHALVLPITKKPDAAGDHIDATTVPGLHKVLANLGDARIWPPTNAALPAFEKLALAELRAAADMDCLAARRNLLAKDLRADAAVPARTLQTLAADMNRMSRTFARLWLLRNKPSRLRDNLRLFARASAEAKRFAK